MTRELATKCSTWNALPGSALMFHVEHGAPGAIGGGMVLAGCGGDMGALVAKRAGARARDDGVSLA